MATTTATRVDIEFEKEPADFGQLVDRQMPDWPALRVQPRGVRLDNDGCHTYWISPGRYELSYDGVGWRVTGGQLDPGHVYRLADATAPKGTYRSTLPMTDGWMFILTPGQVYRLELAGSDDAARGFVALYLSVLDLPIRVLSLAECRM